MNRVIAKGVANKLKKKMNGNHSELMRRKDESKR